MIELTRPDVDDLIDVATAEFVDTNRDLYEVRVKELFPNVLARELSREVVGLSYDDDKKVVYIVMGANVA